MSSIEKRKLRKVGNSYTLTIPVNVVEKNDWEVGDTLGFYTEDEKLVVKKSKDIEEEFTPDFLEMVKDIADRNDATLKELVNR